MTQASSFLQDLALVLCVAAVTTVLFHRLRQSTVLGYLLAGLLLGPHVPIPLFANEETVRTLAELGVIFVMFSIGMEFTVERFVSVLPTAGFTALIEMSVMFWLGYGAGQFMGWTPMVSVFTGSITAFSSTMITSKALSDQNNDNRLSRLVIGILVVQDLAAVFLVSFLTPLSNGARLSFHNLLTTTGSLLGFLGVLFGTGFLVVPRVIRAVLALRNSETLLVATVGTCFAMALLAQKGGYSVALGAFLGGMLVAESGAVSTISRLIHPLKDMFSAIFFVAVGMLVDPTVLVRHWGAILALILVVLLGQVATVSVGAFFSGRPLKTAIQAGMSLAQIGEFSFIIAQLGVSNGAVPSYFYDVTVAVSVATAFATPWLVRSSVPLSRLVDGSLPKPVQTFTALYASWLEKLKADEWKSPLWIKARGSVLFLLLDVFCLTVLTIWVAADLKGWTRWIDEALGLPVEGGKVLVAGIALAASIPFFIGAFRNAGNLGRMIADAAFPSVGEGEVDLGLAPRRVLALALQLGIVLAAGFPYLALTQPFIPSGYNPVILGLLLLTLGIVFWKSAVNLQGHVTAGAEMVANAIARHGSTDQDAVLEQINLLVPGIGAPVPFTIGPESRAAGKSLGSLNLRGLTGASVITILRGSESLVMPSGKEVLRPGDKVVLVGTHEAVDQAKGLL